MTYEECYQSERAGLTQKNKTELEKTAKKFLSGEKTTRGNHPQDVRKLEIKVSNYLVKHPALVSTQSVESILEILANPKDEDFLYELCCSIFTKEPEKQNLSERSQLRYLTSVKNLNASKLNPDGHGSLRFVDADLVRDKKKKDLKGKKTKSIDFRVQHPSGDEELIYAKDTRGAGGGQDNQCEDVRCFLREASKFLAKNPHCISNFTALVDGDYYGESVTKELREIMPNNLKNRIRVVRSNDF
tara:strand:- start:48 stop:779 length:732 start_codon:yes stop_codon:yes gene_type:complete